MSRNPLLRNAEIGQIAESRHSHALDRAAQRLTRSLGDAVGLKTIGVHLVRLEPGRESTVYHFHHQDEEWMYILAGHGVAEIGGEKFDVGPGDFMGFVAGSAPHTLVNVRREDLVYLVGGNRCPIDICDYPRYGMRRYRVDGVSEFVRLDALSGTPPPRNRGGPRSWRRRARRAASRPASRRAARAGSLPVSAVTPVRCRLRSAAR